MKRCPQCGREYDVTMSYCLDDGSELLYGPAGTLSDEPRTAILHETGSPDQAATRAQMHTTDQTAVLPSGITEFPVSKGFDKRLILGSLVLVLIALGGFFGYKYLGSGKQINSIAVMPFAYDSGNADVEYLSDGMTETLIKSLSGLPGLDVKPRSTVFRYKGKDTDLQTIGKELNVQAILNGRIAQHADQLTLSLELVDVQKNSVLWSEQYQRKQSDLVSLQSEIAKDVSTKLIAKLSGAEETKVTKPATTDPDAYQAYLKGRYYWNRRTSENLKKAIEQFKAATDRDPNYAVAFAGLADCYALLNEYAGTPTSETTPQAKTYAERALSLDPQLAEPHATLGQVYTQLWQWSDAEREYKQAIYLNPNYPTAYHWYSILLRDMGRHTDALAMIKRAHEIDPMSSVIGVNLSLAYQGVGDDPACIENSLKLIELDPSFGFSYETIAQSYLRLGRIGEAVTAAEKAAELTNREYISLGQLGYVYAVVGKRSDANALIKDLEAAYSRKEAHGFSIAAIYGGLGDKNKAFEWLEKDFQNRDGTLAAFLWEIEYDPIRDDPRFKDLKRRMNLPE